MQTLLPVTSTLRALSACGDKYDWWIGVDHLGLVVAPPQIIRSAKREKSHRRQLVAGCSAVFCPTGLASELVLNSSALLWPCLEGINIDIIRSFAITATVNSRPTAPPTYSSADTQH